MWLARLDRTPERLIRMQTKLDLEETARADRFFMDAHRNRFVAGRALLRDLLAGYLGQPPEAIRFTYNGRASPRSRRDSSRATALQPVAFPGLAMYAFVLEHQTEGFFNSLQSTERRIECLRSDRAKTG